VPDKAHVIATWVSWAGPVSREGRSNLGRGLIPTVRGHDVLWLTIPDFHGCVTGPLNLKCDRRFNALAETGTITVARSLIYIPNLRELSYW
jgi:hypothetical protein